MIESYNHVPPLLIPLFSLEHYVKSSLDTEMWELSKREKEWEPMV